MMCGNNADVSMLRGSSLLCRHREKHSESHGDVLRSAWPGVEQLKVGNRGASLIAPDLPR